MGKHYTEPITVHSFEHMRNGSAGRGFYTILFTSPDNPKTPMLAISFESNDEEMKEAHAGEIAFLDVNLLMQGKILFPENSFRYEYFYKEIQRVIKEYEEGGWKNKYPVPDIIKWMKMMQFPYPNAD